jgi:hypothetical protein
VFLLSRAWLARRGTDRSRTERNFNQTTPGVALSLNGVLYHGHWPIIVTELMSGSKLSSCALATRARASSA